MGERVELPRGFRFYPRDEELINDYWKPKVLGQKLSCNFIDTVELYGPKSTPWQIFDVSSWMDSCSNLTERFIYVFTTLSKLRACDSNKAKTRENTSKKAGCGTWGGKTNYKIKDYNGNVIGEKRLLGFEINDLGAEFDIHNAGYFKMHEFSLTGINKDLKNDLVLCRITYDSSKQPSIKLPSISTSQGECQSNNEILVRSVGVDENLQEGSGEVEENLKGSVGVEENLQRARCSTSEIFVEMNIGVGDNLDGRSVGVGDNNLEGVENLQEGRIGVEENLEGSAGVEENLQGAGYLTSESVVEMNTGVGDNLEGRSVGVGDNDMEGVGNLASESLVEMNNVVGDNVEGTEFLTSENLFKVDNGFNDFDTYLAANYDQYNNSFLEFDELAWDPGFDMNWFNNLLTSGQEDQQIEDNSKLGKRKLEEENLYETSKKMCL